MANFETHILSVSDGSWDRFRSDWQTQCVDVGDTFEDYAPDSLKVVAEIVAGTLLGLDGSGGDTRVGALWDKDTGRYYACCMLNLARLPETTGKTLRIRHLLVSPLLDYGKAPVALYPDVLIGFLVGVVNLSATVMKADHIRFHLRSPADQAFFKAFGTDLEGSGVFASVQTFGTWLYITKTVGEETSAVQESK